MRTNILRVGLAARASKIVRHVFDFLKCLYVFVHLFAIFRGEVQGALDEVDCPGMPQAARARSLGANFKFRAAQVRSLGSNFKMIGCLEPDVLMLL